MKKNVAESVKTGNNEELILNVKDLSVEYRTMEGVVYALNGMDVEIKKGETLGLVGETGAGKTTAALAVLKLIPNPPGVVTKGSVILNGESVLDKTEKEMYAIRGKKVSMIFQDPMTSLNPVIPVLDQIMEPIIYHERVSKAVAQKKALEMLEKVGISSVRAKEYPHQFSGGMKQRVVIAIALACNPELLIADEPTTALDVTIQAQVLEMMRKMRDDYNMSMMMITHNLGIVAETCDKVSVVYAGRVVEHGTVRDIFKNTRHPYTEGLFNSMPDMKNPRAELKPIKGLMPDPTIQSGGCPFAPRCNYASDICLKQKPKRYNAGGDHYVECHLYNEETATTGGLIKR